jgi:membrane carboxypeptidase/penicillin-binding protein PbpC
VTPRRGRERFTLTVWAGGHDAAHGPQVVGRYATARPAIVRLCEVIQQWAASEGAIAPGTRMSIMDNHDGGPLMEVKYLGYESTQLMGGSKTWQELASGTQRPRWPR